MQRLVQLPDPSHDPDHQIPVQVHLLLSSSAVLQQSMQHVHDAGRALLASSRLRSGYSAQRRKSRANDMLGYEAVANTLNGVATVFFSLDTLSQTAEPPAPS